MVSPRAQIVTRRTYSRPIDESAGVFETWEQTCARVVEHQRWLWERAKGSKLTADEDVELCEMFTLLRQRKASVAGRTLWLGGTEVAKRREASMFNCSFLEVETVHDVVDAMWLLLQGCGVGFRPRPGVLNGFAQAPAYVEILRSSRTDKSGVDHNVEEWDATTRTWTIRFGDSAEAWAKAFGKLVAGKHRAEVIVLDLRNIRPAGERLKGYGWICSGDDALARCLDSVSSLLSARAGSLLSAIDILDLVNWMGTVLSSRRSAEIALLPYDDPERDAFIAAKSGGFWEDNPQRSQSNNSIIFWHKPTYDELSAVFQKIIENGGGEPGFINGASAKRRAPWWRGVNPCAEILLGNRSFCNLVEIDLAKFNGDLAGLKKAIALMARANYRQTCVELEDGILQRAWHEGNEFLRLCGVGVTGIVRWDHKDDAVAWRILREIANHHAKSMADELKLPHPKAVTTVKPSGTLSKIMDTTEGVHKPLGKYIFNNINFGKHDPLLPALRDAGYRIFDNPADPEAVAVTFPVSWEDIEFDDDIYNFESAVDQLNRYKLMMRNYVDHNCSITVSYSPEEVPEIILWLLDNWDDFVAVSWLFRNDPTKRAEDLGFPYLPQEVVTKEEFEAYTATLKPVDLSNAYSHEMIEAEDCPGGVCPVR